MIPPTAFDAATLTWRWCRFDALTLTELEHIYMARQQVFGIEQNCVYLDIDGFDQCRAFEPPRALPKPFVRASGVLVKPTAAFCSTAR